MSLSHAQLHSSHCLLVCHISRQTVSFSYCSVYSDWPIPDTTATSHSTTASFITYLLELRKCSTNCAVALQVFVHPIHIFTSTTILGSKQLNHLVNIKHFCRHDAVRRGEEKRLRSVCRLSSDRRLWMKQSGAQWWASHTLWPLFASVGTRHTNK